MLVHLNGQLLPRDQARIDPFDRGFVFGEGVYEGLRSIPWPSTPQTVADLAALHMISSNDILKKMFVRGKLATRSTHIDATLAREILGELGVTFVAQPSPGSRIVGLQQHIARMQRGLDAARIPFDVSNLGKLSAELSAANNLTDAFVYWQITGGTPGDGDPVRSRARAKNTSPTIFGYCSPQPPLTSQSVPPLKRILTLRDIRWEMGWLKSTSLMGNVISAQRADERRCDEAIFFRDGLITEGLATNVVLALPNPREPDGVELVTPSLDSAPLLAGITRQILLKVEPRLHERPIRIEELETALEIMFLGTITTVASAIELNGQPVGDGTPGPHARALLKTLIAAIHEGRDIE